MALMRKAAPPTGASTPELAGLPAVAALPTDPLEDPAMRATMPVATSMDVVAHFLLEQARQPALGHADQERLEDLLFAYLDAGSSPTSALDERPRRRA